MKAAHPKRKKGVLAEKK
jgi:hypothetical protein